MFEKMLQYNRKVKFSCMCFNLMKKPTFLTYISDKFLVNLGKNLKTAEKLSVAVCGPI